MIEAVIYDMDGLLVNSEPFWRRAQRETFGSVGLELTEDDMRTTMGRRIDEVVAHWAHERPWQGASQKDIEAKIVDRVIELMKTEGKPLNGVVDSLQLFQSRGLPLAVASSSAMEIIEAALDAMGIRDYFSELFSAEHETHGKPHPAVFITTAEHLGMAPHRCLVFEDSPSGILAAKAAKMVCVAVPDAEHKDHPYMAIADMTLDSLTEFNEESFNKLSQ